MYLLLFSSTGSTYSTSWLFEFRTNQMGIAPKCTNGPIDPPLAVSIKMVTWNGRRAESNAIFRVSMVIKWWGTPVTYASHDAVITKHPAGTLQCTPLQGCVIKPRYTLLNHVIIYSRDPDSWRATKGNIPSPEELRNNIRLRRREFRRREFTRREFRRRVFTRREFRRLLRFDLFIRSCDRRPI